MAANSLSELCEVARQIGHFSAALADAREDRDALIRDALGAGFSEREVARAAGVSAVRVHQLKTKEVPYA